jgi:hypothetical protein
MELRINTKNMAVDAWSALKRILEVRGFIGEDIVWLLIWRGLRPALRDGRGPGSGNVRPVEILDDLAPSLLSRDAFTVTLLLPQILSRRLCEFQQRPSLSPRRSVRDQKL